METVSLLGQVVRETEKALLVSVLMVEPDPVGYGGVEFQREAWLPKSQVSVTGNGIRMGFPEGETGIEFEIPTWLARQKGLDLRAPFRNARQQVSVVRWHGRYQAS